LNDIDIVTAIEGVSPRASAEVVVPLKPKISSAKFVPLN
jgi:hypothetical protein